MQVRFIRCWRVRSVVFCTGMCLPCKMKLLHFDSFVVSGRCREFDITKERVQKILASGANVILTTGGIDDICLKYFVEAGAMAVRRVLKRDIKRIAKASGGKPHTPTSR